MAEIVWFMLFGLGIFLYGMSCLEDGLSAISDARLKRWLVQFTATPVSSAGFGVVITMLLQSSSMVSLLVLAFASAGIIPLYNGIGVILGANVGTTATGWLVTMLGFKLDLEQLAIPLVGLGCLSQILLKSHLRAYALGRIVLGLGLLLFGLSLMKGSVADLPASWDISLLQGQPAVLYLLAGMLITALIQSSSATMMLTLTALHAGLINLPEAAALVIGADIGTTSTTVLGSLAGSAVKKRLALSHLVFNLAVDLAAFVLLLPLLPQLLALLSISDPLYSLVAFHSVFNLLGLMCFLPFLKPFSRWIESCFKQSEGGFSDLDKMPTDVPEAALPVLNQQVRLLLLQGFANNLKHFRIAAEQLEVSAFSAALQHELPGIAEASWHQQYELIKDREGELMRFVLRMQQQPLAEQQARRLTGLLEVVRALVYGCKAFKDIHGNLARLYGSLDAGEHRLFEQQKVFHVTFYRRLVILMLGSHVRDYQLEELESLRLENDRHHQNMNERVYESAGGPTDMAVNVRASDDAQLSTQLNMNHEIHHANKSLLLALSAWLMLQQGDGEVLDGTEKTF
ncbi:MAG: Na/Pi symporter [Pseudomonadales bacterium]